MRHADTSVDVEGTHTALTTAHTHRPTPIQYNTIQYNIKLVTRHM